MELDPQEVRYGWTWLLCAGFIAVCFSFSLYYVDNMLTYSDREQRLGDTLRELRTAQFTVAGDKTDLRALSPDLSRSAAVHHSDVHVEHHGHDSHH